MIQISLSAVLAGCAHWLGGMPLLLVLMAAQIIWGVATGRRPKRHSPPAPVAPATDATSAPAGSMWCPSGAYVPAPDPTSLTYLSAVALLRGDTDVARRVYAATRGE